MLESRFLRKPETGAVPGSGLGTGGLDHNRFAQPWTEKWDTGYIRTLDTSHAAKDLINRHWIGRMVLGQVVALALDVTKPSMVYHRIVDITSTASHPKITSQGG